MSVRFSRGVLPGGLAYLFPGQGSQEVGMGAELAARSPAARETLEEADSVLDMPLTRLCAEGPAAELQDTVNAQPAILTVSIAAWRAAAELTDTLPYPVGLAGHSLGEFSALVAAGALDFADGLKLVRERGRLMREMGRKRPGRMAAVLNLDADTLRAACAAAARETGGAVQVANDNHAAQQVISGDVEAVEAAGRRALENGARRILPLAVSIASHSPLMAEAGPRWRELLAEVPFRAPEAPVTGNTTARPLPDAAAVRTELGDQMEGGVLWRDSMQSLAAAGMTAAVEFGSGSVLTGIMRRIDRRTPCFALGGGQSLEEWPAWLENVGRTA